MAVLGTGKCLGWQYPALLLFSAVQTSTVYISAIKEPAQAFQAGFWASLMPYHHFVLAKFSILFDGNFCEQQLVLGKLSTILKWATFCVSFVRVLTILGWLQCFKIFKIDCLVTSNVQFGTVSSHNYHLV